MTFKNLVLILFFVFQSAEQSYSQQSEQFQSLLQNLQKYADMSPQEKVYLHFDKPHYLTGDDIWFKAYITIGTQNRLSALSRILYVDLIGPDNKIKNTLKTPVLSGVCMGDLHLADSLDEGTYQIRAYTRWMRNSPEETFFSRKFTVGHLKPEQVVPQSSFSYNKPQKQLTADILLKGQDSAPLPNTALEYKLVFANQTSASGQARTDANGQVQIGFKNSKDLDLGKGILNLKITLPNKAILIKDIPLSIRESGNKVQFLPEGGNLVDGLQSRVAFKILKPDGLGIAGTGYIEDDRGTKLDSFKTGYSGMGSFQITPEPGRSYKAILTCADSKTQTCPLPAALKEGYVLSLNQGLSYVYVGITASPSLVKNQKTTILVQRQGEVLYAGEKIISSPVSISKLALDNYPSGIFQITLFDENLQPVCERLFFNLNKNTTFPLSATMAKDKYGVRQQVIIDINAGAAGDSLRMGTFSASVINQSKLPPVPSGETGILAGLLLNPELRGYIENPDYYFEEFGPAKLRELDDLVLCQGWRRIVWNDIRSGKTPSLAFKPENGFSIEGTISRHSGDPVPKAKVSLLSTDVFGVMDTVSDEKGHFIFDRLLLRDKSNFAVQARDAAGKKNVVIKLDQYNDLPAPAADSIFPYSTSGDLYQGFVRKNYASLPDSVKSRLFSTNNLINQVEVKVKKINKVTYSSNLNGPGVADQVFVADDLQNSVTLKQFLEGRAMGVRFNGDTAFSSRSALAGATGSAASPMMIIVDGIQRAPDEAPLVDIPVSDVQSIEILRTIATTVVYGASSGVIIITTKTGNGGRVILPSPENINVSLRGYSAIREFYLPDYSMTPVPANSDHRSTILWKPDVITDKNGNASFSFYTSDDKGTYRLRIEGMNADGRAGTLIKTFKVE